MKKSVLVMAAALSLTACNQATKQAEEVQEPKSLVLYYSLTETTTKVAEEFAKQTGADIVAFDLKEPYSKVYDEAIQRSMKDREEGVIPELDSLKVDLSAYQTIYLGFPIWFGTYATPVKSLLAAVDLSGKKVVPFATFGSGGRNVAEADLKKALPNADVTEAFGIRQANVEKAPAAIKAFLLKNGLVEGEYVALPEFSELQDVTEEQKAIFNEATGSYSMLHATPLKVATRTIEEGTEFKYTAEDQGRDGQKSEITIYVVKPAAEGQPAYFTEVVR